MKTLTILILLVALAGCAGPGYWTNPNKSFDDLMTESYNCENDGNQFAANQGFNGNPFIIASRTRECMQAHGWRWNTDK